MTLTPFTQLISAMEKMDDHQSIVLPSDWLQGRTAYGGLSASLCVEAANRNINDLLPLRSAQFTFVGPATGQLRISTNVLRKGKSTVLIGSDLEGDDGLAVRSTLCFGAERTSAHDYQSLPPPEVLSPNDCPSYYEWPNRPNFMKHFEGKLAGGARPGTPDAKPEMTVWLKHVDNGDDSSLVRLLALADALPPAGMTLFKEVIPISTMTWSIEMLDASPSTANSWWLVQAKADTMRHGYSAQSTVIWNSEGKPILVARQNVAIFG